MRAADFALHPGGVVPVGKGALGRLRFLADAAVLSARLRRLGFFARQAVETGCAGGMPGAPAGRAASSGELSGQPLTTTALSARRQDAVQLVVGAQVLIFGQVVDGVQRYHARRKRLDLKGRLAISATTYSPCSPMRLRASCSAVMEISAHTRYWYPASTPGIQGTGSVPIRHPAGSGRRAWMCRLHAQVAAWMYSRATGRRSS